MPNPWFDDVSKIKEEILETEQVFKGSFLNIQRDKVRCANQSVHTREYVKHRGACAMLAFDAGGRIILEWQWRDACKKPFVEIPAGKIDPGEDIFSCARRELEEETGYIAHELAHLGTIRSAIAYSEEKIDIFVCTRLEQGRTHFDAGECLQTRWVDFDEVYEAAISGVFDDAKTLVGILWGRAYFNGKKKAQTRTF